VFPRTRLVLKSQTLISPFFPPTSPPAGRARRALTWWNEAARQGLQFDYRTIHIHAISRDVSTYPVAHVYCQLGRPAAEGDVDNGSDDDGDEEAADQGPALRTNKDGTALLADEARFLLEDPQGRTASSGRGLAAGPASRGADAEQSPPAPVSFMLLPLLRAHLASGAVVRGDRDGPVAPPRSDGQR